MNILIANFNYEGMSEAEAIASSTELAPHFANIPGCLEKTWLIDPEVRSAGGVYKFTDRASLDAYLASDLWNAVKSNPHFANLTTRVYGVMEEATRITHGLPAAVATR
ncbi:MAG: YdhR family protein [Dehalococcoidia bacterium]